MIRSTLALLIVGWICLPVHAAVTLDHLALPVDLRYGYATTPNESLETSVTLIPEAEVALPGADLHLSARLWGDGRDLLEPGRPDLTTYSAASRPLALGDWGRLELRDAYLQTGIGPHLFRIGKQQIVWGALDGIKVLDALNPQNFREFVLEPFGESRIGLWSAYADFLFDTWRAEVAFIPDTTAHEIPVPGAWFELTAPRFRYGSDPESPGLPLETQRPDADEGTIGVRLSRTLGRVELAAQYVSGIDFEPLGRVVVSDGELMLERFYETRRLYGAKLETAFGPLAVRLEAGYQPRRTFNTRSGDRLETVRLDQWRAAVGVDVDGPLGIFLNLQYLYDQVLAAPDDLVRPDIDRILTVFARRRFAYDTVTAELRWYGELGQDNGMVRGSLGYALGENTNLELSADGFYGPEDGLFGQFTGRSRIVLSLSHAF